MDLSAICYFVKMIDEHFTSCNSKSNFYWVFTEKLDLYSRFYYQTEKQFKKLVDSN